LYNWFVSWISTWRRPTYRAETCSCIPTVLLDNIYLFSTVRVTHKILCYWSNTTGMTHLKNIEAPSHNQCYCEKKTISNAYFDCLSVVLVVQHHKRMRRVILSSVVCPSLSYFSTLSHKRHDLWVGEVGVTERKRCFDFLYNVCLKIFLF